MVNYIFISYEGTLVSVFKERQRGGCMYKKYFLSLPFPLIPLVYQLSLGRHLFLTLAFLCRKLMMAAKLFIH